MIKHATNEELRRLKSLHRLTIPQIQALLTSERWGGPGASTIGAWLAPSKYAEMPPNSMDLLIIRLEEAGYCED